MYFYPPDCPGPTKDQFVGEDDTILIHHSTPLPKKTKFNYGATGNLFLYGLDVDQYWINETYRVCKFCSLFSGRLNTHPIHQLFPDEKPKSVAYAAYSMPTGLLLLTEQGPMVRIHVNTTYASGLNCAQERRSDLGGRHLTLSLRKFGYMVIPAGVTYRGLSIDIVKSLQARFCIQVLNF